jgi:asparagine synthase (glutamine-hydrolysing)
MCGICGIIGEAPVEPHELGQMLKVISHRGPDDEGVFIAGGVGLGSRRLSIIDLPGGRQPIANEDGTIWVIHNGEIYNHLELRLGLEQRGHVFRTRSDTEVIVHLYEELGEQCVERLSGMFASAIWDSRQHKLVLMRDRLGQKPLFYALAKGEFRFASEVKSILAVGAGQREIDLESLHDFLSLRFVPSPRTMLRHIHKLPPAHVMVYQHGRVSLRRYWDLSFRAKLDLSEAEYVERLGDTLRQVIASHLISDVPVGAFLSGGMDSSMIVAIAARDLGRTFQTFAIGVEEQDFNELPYARMVAERYGTQHFEHCVQSNLMELVPRMVWHLDEPSDPIAACQYYSAELAARHVKVVLGGDGGDELFAGFDRYRGLALAGRYAQIPATVREHAISPLLARMPDSFAYKSLAQRLRWAHQLAQLSEPGLRYAEATCYFRFNHRAKQALFNPDIWQRIGQTDSAEVIATQFTRADADDPLDRMLYADIMTRLPEHSLMLSDRMSMAHGLELRSPYLDHELVELMAAYPGFMKIHGRELKYVLRKLAVSYLPGPIVRRSKQGFMLPVAYWFRDELYPFVKRFLLESDLVRQGFFREAAVRRLIEEHRRGRVDHHVRLWMLLNLEVWYQIHIQRVEVSAITDYLRDLRSPVPSL